MSAALKSSVGAPQQKDASDQHDSQEKELNRIGGAGLTEAEAAPPMQTLSQYRGSNNDQHMGANELESSPEVRSHYLQAESQRINDAERASEPKSMSRQPSHPAMDADMPSSSPHP